MLGWRYAIVLCVFACSTAQSVPDPFLTGKDPRFSSDRYIVGVGSGQTLEGARQRAVVSIGAQLQATLRSVDHVSSRFGMNSTAGEVHRYDSEDAGQDIRQETSFSRPEWVQIADTHRSGNEVWVLAILDRHQAAQAVDHELTERILALRREIQRADEKSELKQLAEALPVLRGSRQEIERRRILLAALRRESLPNQVEFDAILELEDRYLQRRGAVRLQLCLDPPQAKSAPLSYLLEARLNSLGLRTLPCSAQPEANVIRLEGRLDHHLIQINQAGAFPYFCTVRGVIRAQDGMSGGLLHALSDAGVRAGGMGAEQACSASAQHLADSMSRSLGLIPPQ